jgi:hypothetical protein
MLSVIVLETLMLPLSDPPPSLPQAKKTNGANNKIVSPQNFRNFICFSFLNVTKPDRQILCKNRALLIGK